MLAISHGFLPYQRSFSLFSILPSSCTAMETSATCVSRSHTSILFSPFSDQTHLDFYRHRSASLPSPSLSLNLSPSRSLPSASSSKASLPPLRALCENAFASPASAFEKDSLMKELAALKLQMKQKKKELKSQKKDEKKRLKLQAKEEKKTMMPKDCGTEGKKKKKCHSESSSESSDDNCDSTSMRILRQEFLPASAQVEDTVCEGSSVSSSLTRMTQVLSSASDYTEILFSRSNGEVTSTPEHKGVQKRSAFSSSSSAQCVGSSTPFTQASNRVEVCAGGKCKKAGSEKLLAELGAQLPSSSNVVAMPCKCMGKCSMTMNVKVHKEDTNPQHHSHVRLEDASVILNHHFGLGRPPSGLPCLPPHDRTMAPSTASV